jgi:catechol 2,3-dioxygenase-like lactoylglutathione lyase family enzyme
MLAQNVQEVRMLDNARIVAIVPVSDLETALEFYEGRLGLGVDVRRDDLPKHREAELLGADGRVLLYESVGAGQSRHTVAGFRVDDIDAVVSALRERGVTFEEYDLPDLKTEGGIASVGDVRAAWCKDPDGNIIAIESVGGS